MVLNEKGVFYYGAIKSWLAFGGRFYYRKVKLTGSKENVSKDKAIIFVANHQCTLLDPLVMVVYSHREPAFLARADIFENKHARKFLTAFRMLPIFRKKEAADFVERNKGIFDNCAYLLEHGKSIVIFPEGSHLGMRKLRPLKKGFARIAFQTAKKQNFEEDIFIVPVGLNFENYVKFRKELLINYGEPINIKDYKNIYLEKKPEAALLKIKNDVTDRLKELMIDIESVDHYDVVDALRKISLKSVGEKLGANLIDQTESFNVEKKIIASLKTLEVNNKPEMEALDMKVSDYTSQLKQLDFKDKLFDENVNTASISSKFLLLILSSPIYLLGLISHYFIYKMPTLLSKSKFKDPMFHSSVNMVGAQILGTVLYPLQCLLVWLITGSFWWMLIYLISLPITGLISAEWYRLFIKTKAQKRFLKFKSNNKKQFLDLEKTRESVKGTVLGLIN